MQVNLVPNHEGVDTEQDPYRLTNRSSQPLAAAMTRVDFMKEFLMFETLASTSGG
jgi:hypothetical protein